MKSIFMGVGLNFIHIGIYYGLVVKNFVKLSKNSFAQGDNYIINEDADLNFVRITNDMLKDIKSDKSTA